MNIKLIKAWYQRGTARLSYLREFMGLLLAVTLLVVVYFLLQSPWPTDSRAWAYWLTIPSYYLFVFTLVYLVFGLLMFNRWSAWLVPILGALWLVYVFADVMVFQLYRFHISVFFIKMFFQDFKGLGLPLTVQVLAGLSVLGLLIFSVAAWRRWSHVHLFRRYTGWKFMLAGLLVFAFNQSVHVWAAVYHRGEITKYSAFLPIFAPIQDPKGAHWLSANMPSLYPPEEGMDSPQAPTGKAFVHYPLAPVACTKQAGANILMVVLESWQADMLNPEVMPQTHALAQNAWQFKQHVSGGNATVPGLFSLLFGLHASYYDAFRGEPAQNPSLFTETLQQRHYESRVFASGTLETFSMRPLFFSKVADQHFQYFRNEQTEVEDQHLVNAWHASLKSASTAPRFDFLFLNSSHFPYSSPASFKKFQPVSENKSEYMLNRSINPEPLKNHYRNSLNYLDSLIGQIEQDLKAAGRWENTWVVVVGDHAEEFNENQLKYWGHVSNYSRWQTQTPLIVKPAGVFKPLQVQNPSIHQDVVPTLMTYALGCDAQAIGDYSNGLLLDQLPAQRSTVLGSYVSTAYWVNGTVQDKLLAHLRYDWRDMQQSMPEIPAAAILNLMAEESKFYKR
jgi:membrane-anchored protein YejM (alkaline phosphatase superfamily)